MATQPRLPGTLPSPAQARKAHADAVRTERQALQQLAGAMSVVRDCRAAVKEAQARRQTAEDDLDAIDAGRRPG